MDSEKKPRSTESIRTMQGMGGNFDLRKWRFIITSRVIILTGEGEFLYLICKFVYFIIPTGKCDIASYCRKVADVNKWSVYSQHMTVGLLVNTSLPKAVLNYDGMLWKKKLAEDFLMINYLTCPNISAKLVDDKLENWELTLESQVMVCKIQIKFFKVLKKIEIYFKEKLVTAKSILLSLSVKNCAAKNIKMCDLISCVENIFTVVNRK